jgi:hypothetical protein
MAKQENINLSDKELERDIINLHIPQDKQHTPLLDVDDMDWLSDEQKADFKAELDKTKA